MAFYEMQCPQNNTILSSDMGILNLFLTMLDCKVSRINYNKNIVWYNNLIRWLKITTQNVIVNPPHFVFTLDLQQRCTDVFLRDLTNMVT